MTIFAVCGFWGRGAEGKCWGGGGGRERVGLEDSEYIMRSIISAPKLYIHSCMVKIMLSMVTSFCNRDFANGFGSKIESGVALWSC